MNLNDPPFFFYEHREAMSVPPVCQLSAGFASG